MIIRKGCYRRVCIFDKFVIKFPRFKIGKNFLLRWIIGYLSNTSESYCYKSSKKICSDSKDQLDFDALYKLCPIYFNFFGFLVIMKKANPLSEEEYSNLLKDIKNYNKCNFVYIWDNKIENFGKINDKIVIIDYADDFRGKHREESIFYFK